MSGRAGARPKKKARSGSPAGIGGMFDDLRAFIDERLGRVDRRIADLSDEINATVQMVDFSEANLSRQLQRMHQQIAGVVALPAALPQSSGPELEGVVRQAEAAAHRIISAAESIRAAIARGEPDKVAIGRQLNVILEACSFQDLTGQRIRRALERLQHIERTLGNMVAHAEDSLADGRISVIDLRGDLAGGPELDQDEIDKLIDGD